jgi:co-chaperonin GroES (HSP10)
MITVCGHRVMIKTLEVEDVDDVFANAKRAGIELLDSAEAAQLRKNAVDRGVVLGIGSTAFKDFGVTPWCAIGDVIVYSRYAGKTITDPQSKEVYTIINDEDVIATIKEE